MTRVGCQGFTISDRHARTTALAPVPGRRSLRERVGAQGAQFSREIQPGRMQFEILPPMVQELPA